jgi:hypothetical protein
VILPFQERFAQLPTYDKAIYMVTVLASVTATILLTSPVAAHRLLFRRRALADLVSAAHRAALTGLMLLGVALTGVVVLVTDVVVGLPSAIAVAVAAVTAFVGIWVIHPLLLRRRFPSPPALPTTGNPWAAPMAPHHRKKSAGRRILAMASCPRDTRTVTQGPQRRPQALHLRYHHAACGLISQSVRPVE